MTRPARPAVAGLLALLAAGCGGPPPPPAAPTPAVAAVPAPQPAPPPTPGPANPPGGRPAAGGPPAMPTPDAPPGFLTPEPADLPADLRAAGEADAEYPLPQDKATAGRVRATRLVFAREQTVGQLDRAGNAAAPWAARAREALAAESVCRAAGPDVYRPEAVTRVAAARAALAAGCDHPLVRLLRHRHTRPRVPDRAADVRAAAAIAAAADAARLSAYCRADAHWQAVAEAVGLGRVSEAVDPHGEGVFDPLWPPLADLARDRDPEAERAVVELCDRVLSAYAWHGLGREAGHARAARLLAAAGATAWVRRTVEGRFLVDWAWDARGGGTADTVTADGWRLFRDRLGAAEAALRAAWEAAPDRPEPAVAMLRVCRGLGADRGTMEGWFRRAMTADPDCRAACRAKLLYLAPKWGGRRADMVAFGRQCARTGNWHAGLPFLLYDAYGDGDYTRPDDPAFAAAEAWADVREVFEPRLVAVPTDRPAREAYAVVCLTAGRYDAAYHQFHRLATDAGPPVAFAGQLDLPRLLGLARSMYMRARPADAPE